MSPRRNGISIPEDLLNLVPPEHPEHWQMLPGERLVFEYVLNRLRPKVYLEIGVYFGGSLCLASNFCQDVVGVDIEPEVMNRFSVPSNVQIRIGHSAYLVPQLLSSENLKPDLILVDGDHAFESVYNDVRLISENIKKETIVLFHDTAHASVRNALKSAFEHLPQIVSLDLDLVPGRIIMEGGGKNELWGGLGIAKILPPDINPELPSRSFEASAEDLITRANASDVKISKREDRKKSSRIRKIQDIFSNK